MKELSHLNKYFFKYRWQLLLGILITIVARVFTLVMPSYVNKSIQVVEQYASGDLNRDEAGAQLLGYIGIIIGATAMAAIFTFLMRQTIINVSRYIEYDLKNEVYAHYQRLSLSFYKRNRIGDLMNRISEDVSQVRMYCGPVIMYGITNLTLFACLLPLMFIKAPEIAFYTVLPLPVLSVLIYVISRVIHERSTRVQEFLSELSTFTQETFSGISVIKAYTLEEQTQAELDRLADKGKDVSMSLAKVNAWFFPLMILLIGVSNLFVMYIGGMQYINGEIESLGIIAEFIMYVNMLTWPVAVVGWLTSVIQRAAASQKRINEFLQQRPEILDDGFCRDPIKGAIEFEEVSFTYPDTGIKALDGVSFRIDPGQTYAIMGRTGSGKSTLLDLLGRLYEVDTGEIRIDGKPLKEFSLQHLRSAMGVVPQDGFLFSDSIRNNIGVGKAEATPEDIEQAARLAAVHDNIEGFRDGYETVLGERGISLSGGQKQRVSIARALIKDPEIFAFDDCLSAVDTETEEVILGHIRDISASKTTLLVSHRVSTAKHTDRVLVIEDGRIIQEGTHDVLLSEPGYYRDLYEEQLAGRDA